MAKGTPKAKERGKACATRVANLDTERQNAPAKEKAKKAKAKETRKVPAGTADGPRERVLAAGAQPIS